MSGLIFLILVILVTIILALVGSKDKYNEQAEQIQRWEGNIKAKINLMPDKIASYKNGFLYNHLAVISVNNYEKREITDCTATLITIKDLTYRASPEEVIKQRLQWEENQVSDNNCKTILPPLSNNTNLYIAQTDGNRFGFCCCTNLYTIEKEGIYLLNIRLDGKIKGINIEPIHFYGILRIDNEEMTVDGKPTGEMIKSISTFDEINNE